MAILAFSGSSRLGSFNKQALKIAIAGAKEKGTKVSEIDLREFSLPIYDADLEKERGLPGKVMELKTLFLEHRGLLIACPEYNSSITPLLKNALDWVSRPVPNEAPLACFVGKVASLVSASPGALGGMRALMELRTLLCNIQVIVLPRPVSVQKANEAFLEDGNLKDERMQRSLMNIGRELAQFLKKE